MERRVPIKKCCGACKRGERVVVEKEAGVTVLWREVDVPGRENYEALHMQAVNWDEVTGG